MTSMTAVISGSLHLMQGPCPGQREPLQRAETVDLVAGQDGVSEGSLGDGFHPGPDLGPVKGAVAVVPVFSTQGGDRAARDWVSEVAIEALGQNVEEPKVTAVAPEPSTELDLFDHLTGNEHL